MKDFVSVRATNLVGAAASLSIVALILTPYGFPWPVLTWGSLALMAGGLLALTSTRSIRKMISDAALAVAPAVMRPIQAVRLSSRGKGTR
jgi:hypothetical protein